MSKSTTHIIGAGVAGLAAAVMLCDRGRKVILYEAAPQAGGRCRSYEEPALGQKIDNGNHLIFSGNKHIMNYCRKIGSWGEWVGPDHAVFDFVELSSGQQWQLRPNDGPIPWWIFVKNRRVPNSSFKDYFDLFGLMRASPNDKIADLMACEGLLYQRLWQPFLLAALNIDPPQASALLARALISRSLALGGSYCRPRVAANGLSSALIDPALDWIGVHGGIIRFSKRLRALNYGRDRVVGLEFADESIALSQQDQVILATPASISVLLVPQMQVPTQTSAILNAHFRFIPPAKAPPILGLIGGTAEWIFNYRQRISVTISDADRFMETPRQELAQIIWQDVQRAFNLNEALPPWQIVKERRATFAATVEQNACRPKAKTPWSNLLLAGDYTQTELPATIEGAVSSGITAANLTESAINDVEMSP